MANKYIISGATYCGKGNGPNVASANDEDGAAWNNTNIIEGTAPAYGIAPAAGDVVYVRSKASGDTNITRTLTASLSLGSTAATADAPITWVLDNGTIWSGIDGTFKYTHASNYTVTFRVNNVFISKTTGAWEVEITSASPTGANLALNYGHVIGWAFDISARSGGNAIPITMYTGAILEDPIITVGQLWNGQPLIGHQDYTAWPWTTVINPTISVDSVHSSGGFLFGNNYTHNTGRYLVIGGRVTGNATNSTNLYATILSQDQYTSHWYVELIGFKFPVSMSPAYVSPVNIWLNRVTMSCVDDALGGYRVEKWGYATSRSDNNPPTLSAQLPTSGTTAWAWRIYADKADVTFPVIMTSAKTYTASAVTKTVTLEALVSNVYGLNKANTWMTVQYVDNATGAVKHLTTKDPAAGALTTSSANWSATTWGLFSGDKVKFSIETPTSIKQDTAVIVTFWCSKKAPTTNDMIFLDPDFSLT